MRFGAPSVEVSEVLDKHEHRHGVAAAAQVVREEPRPQLQWTAPLGHQADRLEGILINKLPYVIATKKRKSRSRSSSNNDDDSNNNINNFYSQICMKISYLC